MLGWAGAGLDSRVWGITSILHGRDQAGDLVSCRVALAGGVNPL